MARRHREVSVHGRALFPESKQSHMPSAFHSGSRDALLSLARVEGGICWGKNSQRATFYIEKQTHRWAATPIIYAKLPYWAIMVPPPGEDVFNGMDVGSEVENEAQLLEASHQPNRLPCNFPIVCQLLFILKMD